MNVDPINNVDPIKVQIMSLLAPTPARMQGRIIQPKGLLSQKIQVISQILQDNPLWKPDKDIYERILRADGKCDEATYQFRRELIHSLCCSRVEGVMAFTENDAEMVIINGSLTISQTDLLKLGNEAFWKAVKENKVTTVTIQRENAKPIVHKGPSLSELDKYPVTELVTEFTLTFDSGESVMEPQAKLRRCGDYFVSLFDSGLKEADERVIEISEIPFNGFLGILSNLETGGLDPEIDPEEFKEVADRLQFLPIIDGIYGAKEWSIWGKIEDVAYSKELVEFLNAPCIISQSGKKAKETHTVVWVPHEVDGKPLDVEFFRRFFWEGSYWGAIGRDPIVNEPIKKGYWVAMYTVGDPLEPDKGRADHLKTINKNCKGYVLPTVREALVCTLLPYDFSEKKVNIFDSNCNKNVYFTRCEEMIDGRGSLIVGWLHPTSGLIVNSKLDTCSTVGFRPVRKFC